MLQLQYTHYLSRYKHIGFERSKCIKNDPGQFWCSQEIVINKDYEII